MQFYVLILFSSVLLVQGQDGDLTLSMPLHSSESLVADAVESSDRAILPPKVRPPIVLNVPLFVPSALIKPNPQLPVVVQSPQAPAQPIPMIIPQSPAQPVIQGNPPSIVLPPVPAPQPTPQPTPAPQPVPILPPSQTPPPSPTVQGCGLLNELHPCYSFPTGCYCIVQTPMRWRDSLDYCRAGGKNLLSFETTAKIRDLQDNLPTVVGVNTPLSTAGFWTSGTYIIVVNQYLWASIGQYFTVTNWRAGSPVAPTVQAQQGGTCVQVEPNGFSTGLRWIENDCTLFRPFICQ